MLTIQPLSSCDLKADGVHTCCFVTVLSYCNFVGIHKGTNCAPLLADLFLYTIEAEFNKKHVQEKNQSVVMAFNSILGISTTRYHSTIVISKLTSTCYILENFKKRNTTDFTSFVS